MKVFSASTQLSGSKAGNWNRRREGLSILNILSRCGSLMEVIIHRQQAIAFFTSTGNVEFVQALSISIK